MVEGAVSCVQFQHSQLDLLGSVSQTWIEEDPAGLAVLGMR